MIKALLFDINGTVVDILTDESSGEIYRTVSNLLNFYGVNITPDDFRTQFWQLNKEQRRASAEEYPEFDVQQIFKTIISRYGSPATKHLSVSKQRLLPEILSEVFRAASLFKLELYPGVKSVLDELKKDYQLAAVSDAQKVWAMPELNALGLSDYFSPIVISSDLGYRKPDERIFQNALDEMKVSADEVIFIGNDMYRDVLGGHKAGFRTIYFKSNQGDQRSRGVEPDYIIYEFSQLLEGVRFLAGRENDVQ